MITTAANSAWRRTSSSSTPPTTIHSPSTPLASSLFLSNKTKPSLETTAHSFRTARRRSGSRTNCRTRRYFLKKKIEFKRPFRRRGLKTRRRNYQSHRSECERVTRRVCYAEYLKCFSCTVSSLDPDCSIVLKCFCRFAPGLRHASAWGGGA